ncbi:winged helix-turn-helix domain-containing protein [Acerihabitans sp. TG2]|uniref:winged helix-turn-helix domain-containing protein n=1 Tax=Acerihabitans sp. TG2 TaxID=3096008 RepID=UPI002B2381DE|nr:winged helix-turn-helix domain-containing protein [Acerihabitans sp. TG2]MEA9392568.1 winged helix-turn-helix domain-containing protein [Acerihabitans sp. TG2]
MKLTQPITINHLDVKIAPSTHNRLRWKEYQILSVLVQRSPEAVSRADLIDQIWKGTYCSDSTINQTIKSIRQKIGDEKHEIIKTIPRIGYIIEENQMVNIVFNDNHHTGTNETESSVNTAPKEAIVKDDITETKKNTVPEEDIHTQPIWILPSHSRISKAATTPPMSGIHRLINSIVYFFHKFQRKKTKVILYTSLLIMLVVFSMYSFPAVKQTFDNRNQARVEFNQTSAFSVTCPSGHSNETNAELTCNNMIVKFDDVAFDCLTLKNK